MNADAIVIGAGIVGAAIAEAFAAEGMRVLVIDERFPSAAATAAAMGHIVAMDDAPAQLALTSLSLRLFDAIGDEFQDTIELDRCGTLWIAEDESQMGAAREKAARLEASGVAASVMDGAALRDAEPELRPGLAGAVLVPGDSVVYPPALCAALLERARTHAGAADRVRVLRGTRVERIEDSAVITRTDRLAADVVVNAAGAHAPQLTAGLPIVPRRGHLVITDRHPGFCHHQLIELGYMSSAHGHAGESVAFNVQPRRTGQLLIGSSRELVGFDATINRGIVQRMLRRATSFMPRIERLVALRTWTGFRPATADNLPLIGAWSPVRGLWIAAGHEGLGITTALGTARILADLVLGRTPPIDAQPYSPMRALAVTPSAAVHA